MELPDPDKSFLYESGFYLTAPSRRLGKFVTHLDLYRQIMNLPGDIVECGVFRANSFMRFAKLRALLENAWSRRIVGFDTFGDFPQASIDADKSQRDAFVAETDGGHSIALDDLRDLLQSQGLAENLDLVPGDLVSSAPFYVNKRPQMRVALLHVDVDLYEPTKAALETFYPLMVSGGIVILDDYGAFPGANRAIEEYFSGDNARPIQKLSYTHAIAYLVK